MLIRTNLAGDLEPSARLSSPGLRGPAVTVLPAPPKLLASAAPNWYPLTVVVL